MPSSTARALQQQRKNGGESTSLHLAKRLWQSLCKHVSSYHLGDDCILVIEMLLMMAGDVERNPGPSELYSTVFVYAYNVYIMLPAIHSVQSPHFVEVNAM